MTKFFFQRKKIKVFFFHFFRGIMAFDLIDELI